jgi:hypothetical protein
MGWPWMLWLGCGAPTEPSPEEAPLDARPALDQPLACAPGCERAEQARGALARAAGFVASAVADPDLPLTLDVLIATRPIVTRWRAPALDAAIRDLSPRLDRPGDPRRRLYDPAARLPDSPSTWWEATPGGDAHPSQILVEALYCAEHGMRASTVRWLCDDFRDGGGPKSGHAAWYQALAVDAGCLDRSATCLDHLAGELAGAAEREPPPTSTEERDRLAEQILFGLIAGADSQRLGSAVDRLVASQRSDGAFAPPGAALDRVVLHAALVGGWALDTWLGRAVPVDQQPSSAAASPTAPGAPAPTPPAPPAPTTRATLDEDSTEPDRQTTPIDGPPPPPPP